MPRTPSPRSRNCCYPVTPTPSSRKTPLPSSQQSSARRLVVSAEDFVQFGEEGGLGEGFLDEVDPGFQDALLTEQALGVAGHEHHPGGGLQVTDLAGEFFSLHAGHDDVGEQDVDVV